MGNQCSSKENPLSDAPISRTTTSKISVQDKLLKDNNTFINSCTETYFKKFHKVLKTLCNIRK